MRIILAGHVGSKFIIPASSFLIQKYLPFDFDIEFLNYGAYDGALYTGTYIPLAEAQVGGAERWGNYIHDYLATIDDEYVIFALDDYLFHAEMDFRLYAALAFRLKSDPRIVCARLCTNDFYRQDEREIVHGLDNDFIYLRDNARYSCTTQYCIWRKAALMELLAAFPNPWRFEVEGSERLNAKGGKVIGTQTPAFHYEDCSCLSKNWGGQVRVKKLSDNDIETLISMGHLKREDLILCVKKEKS